MDFLIEFIIEVFFGAIVEGAHDKECPGKLRIVLAIVTSIFCIALGSLLGVLFWQNDNSVLRAVAIFVIALIAVFLVRMWYKIYRNRK